MNGNEKLENQLNLALETQPEEREKIPGLDVGYDAQEQRWELIFRYAGDLSALEKVPSVQIQPLGNGYAIADVAQSYVEIFAGQPQVIYVEKPKLLFWQQQRGIAVSCVQSIRRQPYNLTGKGVITAILDTGIDIFHPDFRDEDGNTRIAALWDQTLEGNPPPPFQFGSLYEREQINGLIRGKEQPQGIPGRDRSGHGTHVASVCAGNRGMAPEAELLVVKLSDTGKYGFPGTVQLMTALRFAVSYAQEHGKPVAVNISYGNNYGDHRGTSLLETYITQMAGQWKSSICIGTGNEGATGRHRHGTIGKENEEILFQIAPAERSVNLQLWKEFTDEFGISLINPSGIQRNIENQEGKSIYRFGSTTVYVYYGTPVPYNVRQEIFFSFTTEETGIDSGQWKLILSPKQIRRGSYALWLPVSSGTNEETRFSEPSETWTLTIPSTADKVIAVGAYNMQLDSYAAFSGRGDEKICLEKPDLTAPGTGILGAAPGGGESIMSGTSMATPFVTGAAALLMEWGIVNGNDGYLYGEKLKACLHKGARPMPGFTMYPNPQVGYGALCVRDSLPV